MTSILRPWVEALPLREQGTLLTSLRGCDAAPKNPVDSLERQMTAYLRWLVCNPADEREVDAHGAFMRSTPPIEPWAPSALEHYPLHWYVHVMHAFEVVGYRHPVSAQRAASGEIYERMVEALHLRSESRPQMIERLSEDRIALGAVTPVAS